MEPQIRYAKTSDGLNIAYYAVGDGPPLIAMSPGLIYKIEGEWKIPNLKAIGEASSRVFTYVRYDPRGCGLSDRQVDDFSVEAMMRDLEAVATVLGAKQFALFATGHLGMAGIAFASRYPERVSRLVLWASAADGRDMDTGRCARSRTWRRRTGG